MTTAHLPTSGRTHQSALAAAEPSPPTTTATDRSPHNRRRPEHLRLVDDRMSVCFEVCPSQAGHGIPERDARRVGMARRVTAARLRYCGLETLVDDATLIVSELVTNAIQHSRGTQVTFTMTVHDGFLHLAVHDETPGRPIVHDADDDAEHGRGLFLVDCLAAARGGTWGTSNEGATTWCRLAVPGSRP